MRKAVLITLGVLVGLVLLIEFGPMSGYMWSGAFPLDVEVMTDDTPPRRVYCQANWNEREAETWCSMLRPDDERVAAADPFEGQSLQVRVISDGRASLLLGRNTAWVQQQYLVVVAEWDDGRRVAKVVPIPDGQTTRTLRVEIP